MDRTVVITGSSGYLGSALCAGLAGDHRIVGVDLRHPSPALRQSTPEAVWENLDISDAEAVSSAFQRAVRTHGGIDFIIHLAAYYHYGRRWRREYDIHNIQGTRNVIEAACRAGTGRLIFAASIASLVPPAAGAALTEEAGDVAEFPYCRSKAAGERLCAERLNDLPAVVMRLGGVFSDWCELPPLYTLMRLWTRRGPIGRCIPGRGKTGFPYIHRNEVVRVVRRIIEKNETLARHEVLFASEDGCTCHEDLFGPIRRLGGQDLSAGPIHIPPQLAIWFLYLKLAANGLAFRRTYEQPWMLAYADRPLRVDTRSTRQKLDWNSKDEYRILNRLPTLMANYRNHRRYWQARNIRRNEGQYEFEP
ncbi:MAG: NAD-dependent epimerase/dehydratase family protein [Hyphomicrobiales bacterium]